MHRPDRFKVLGDHPLTRIDPRVKLVFVLGLLVMVISGRGWLFPLLVGAASLGLCLNLGIRPKALFARFTEPVFIIVMVVLLKMFSHGNIQLFSFHLFQFEVAGYRDGLLQGLLIASRIFSAVSLVSLLGFSTPFTDLMGALAWLRVPRGFVEVSLFAWRYLFILFDDAQVVYEAQKNRLGYAGFRRGLRSFGTLTGCLFIKAFDNSQTLTTAMMQRGYDGKMPILRHPPFKMKELVLSLSLLIVLGLVCSF